MLLGVNIDHVATLRQSRLTRYPDPVYAAQIAEQAGADSITIHLREDRRHIQERDVRILKEVLTIPMNLEMAVTENMLAFAEQIKPDYCCFVPEKREELTTEGGLDVISQIEKIKDACNRLLKIGTRVSLFIDADIDQIRASKKTGAPAIEIHTGHFADAPSPDSQNKELQTIMTGVETGLSEGLMVNAGHGLHYHNVQHIASIPGIHELNIGHSIIARAIFSGLDGAVREMKCLIQEVAQ